MDTVDAYSTVEKQIRMLNLFLHFHEQAHQVIKRGAPISLIHNLPVVDSLIRMKTEVANDQLEMLDTIWKAVDQQIAELEKEYQ